MRNPARAKKALHKPKAQTSSPEPELRLEDNRPNPVATSAAVRFISGLAEEGLREAISGGLAIYPAYRVSGSGLRVVECGCRVEGYLCHSFQQQGFAWWHGGVKVRGEVRYERAPSFIPRARELVIVIRLIVDT